MDFRIWLASAAFLVSACAATTPASIAPLVENASTTELWREHRNPSLSPLQLAFVEAELASRGQTSSGRSYIGQRTASAFGKALYARGNAAATSADLANCSDFGSSWQAQRFFLDAGGPLSDPHDLDRDGDGLACEWGTTLRSSARKATTVRTPVRTRRTYSSRCYVGPRGGTYTITASGRKNYGGC
ncbi:excalibur calcium-binding domain-containing protein [uncultured Roseobacter sp.]|uniref:excalibur calcium-binding domain-containing protein n=1 Tax=uncultured Roseobacter sp. TaxID=114847 RepID=UPI002603EA18|nr:excalibur calcium-binding domain-containing protein [uncultured Roseobacter sp.]